MLKWLKMIGSLKFHKMISQNKSAIQALGFPYAHRKDEVVLARLLNLEDENARIAIIFYRDDRLSNEESQKLRAAHSEIRELFHTIYPTKDFDKTFGPSGSRDPEIGN